MAQHLGRWARALSSSPCASAVPATVTQTDSSLFGFMGRKQAMPPMNVPLEGVETVHPAEVSASPPPTETATLSNGVRIGAQDIMVRLRANGTDVYLQALVCRLACHLTLQLPGAPG